MQARKAFFGRVLIPINDNINQFRRLREHLRRVAEENNLVTIEVEEGTIQIDQETVVGGER